MREAPYYDVYAAEHSPGLWGSSTAPSHFAQQATIMSDTLVAKGSDSKFKPHPEGQYIGVCVDVIDLGEKVQDFPGTVPYLASTCAIVFRTGERNEEVGEYIDIAREFTVSMGDKANLRKFLEQWRGKPYDKADIDKGVPLHKLEGQPGMLSISHKVSGKNRTYANITACVGVPKQMQAGIGKYPDYVRADYWNDKRKAYADAAATFRAATDDQGPDEYPGHLDDDMEDDFPF